ncbi:MAG TPA: hypothetical protein VGS19_38830 [Streptosporangiaceae bacterium]|nr:hypothetical protein [Streptosporangiaceae bacterium]
MLSAAVLASGATAAAAAPTGPAAHGNLTSQQAATPAGAVVVTTAPSKFGPVLVTGSGMALYVFTGDGFPFSPTGPQLDCTALNKAPSGTPCTTAWPPLLATGNLVANGGVHQSGLGTVTRNGVTQVSYFGKPLYEFAKDTAPGQVNGEDAAGFSGLWYLDHVSGRPVAAKAAVHTEVSPNGAVLSSPTASGARTLYLLSFDGPGMTTCAGPCAAVWPPLLTSDRAQAGPGLSRHGLGAFRRPDGTWQVTYRRHPLYFFALDLGAGAPAGLTNGQGFIDADSDGIWYTVLPQGTPDTGTATTGSETAGRATILSVTGGLTKTTATLYAYSLDTPTASNCSTACAINWPPVLTTTAPKAAGGASAALLGVIPRGDGTFQVTYNRHPLYFFAHALNPGTTGAGLIVNGGTFNTITTAGTAR